MHFYSWVIVIGLLIILGMVLKRAWLARQQIEEAPEMAAEGSEEQAGFAGQLTSAVRSRIQGISNGFSSSPQADITVQFRTWATSAFATDLEIQNWLASLADEQIVALTEHLAEFCRDMGFELSWLLDGQIEQNPQLMQGLAQIVLLYSRASYQAVALQEEVEIYRTYHNFMQNPKSRVNRELGEHLFGKLVEQGMSDVAISEHLASSARKRQEQIVETIARTATDHPHTFNTTLKTVLIERAMPAEMVEQVMNDPALNGATTAPASE